MTPATATFPYDGLKYLFNLGTFLEHPAMRGVHFDFDNVPVRKVPGFRQEEFWTMSRLRESWTSYLLMSFSLYTDISVST